MELNDRLVVVTGASGFIGSHLVEALVTEKANVRAFVHYNSRNDAGHLPVVILRPFNTYGPRQSDRAVIPTIITQALTRAPNNRKFTVCCQSILWPRSTLVGRHE